MTRFAFIGFGEAGGLIAAGLKQRGGEICAAFDLRVDDPALADKAQRLGIALARSNEQAVADAEIVLSAVTCDALVDAARQTAPYLHSGHVYLDINSASPKAKREAAEIVERAGASYIDVAVMDLVPPHGHKVPMLLAGRAADDTAARLRSYDMNATAIGAEVGQAAAVKMARSVFMKGFSAILLESLMAAGTIGAGRAVLDSLQITYPSIDWHAHADRAMARLSQHAKRQSQEMYEVAETLEELGVEPITALATARRLAGFADLDRAAQEALLAGLL